MASGSSQPFSPTSAGNPNSPVADLPHQRRHCVLHAATLATAVVAAALLLAFLPGRSSIPPLIESDYCYQLTAAERFARGLGFTSTPPVAPLQPWEWTTDWTFLTHWPIGYPILVVGLRKMFDVSIIEACAWLSILSCTAALVGWFVLAWVSGPPGVTRLFLSLATATSSVAVSSLINPSTDMILVAVLPFVLLTVAPLCGSPLRPPDKTTLHRATGKLIFVGLLAGGLFWIRYASLFLPLAVFTYLVLSRSAGPAGRWRTALIFGCAAALPVSILVILNSVLGSGTSIQGQLNLGRTIGFDLPLAKLGEAWWRLTDLGYYDHRPVGHWLLALWPVVLVIGSLVHPKGREAVISFLQERSYVLTASTAAWGFLMIVGATALFGDKFDYVGLDRYYAPIRPLYFLLFVAPLAHIRVAGVRALLCLGLLLACNWTVRHDWLRTYERWAAAERPQSAQGARSRCFEPGAADLYAWLKEQQSSQLVVVSNYHETAMFETGIPALPIPPSPNALETWLADIRRSRGVAQLRVLFVLDPSNQWRDYWIPDPNQVIENFNLKRDESIGRSFAAYVYGYTPRTS